MPKDMLGVAVRQLVTLPAEVLGSVCDLLGKLADSEWVEAFKRFLRKQEPWPQAAKEALLKLVTTVRLPGYGTFRAKDHFKVGKTGKVAIGGLGDNFQRVFLTGAGKVEQDVPQTMLKIYQLLKGSVDKPIITELGGEAVVETALAQMWEILEAQGHGQKGKLLTNSYANIFYIRDAQGVLWAVDCCWYSSYAVWGVGARPIAGPCGWCAGDRVVSRDSDSVTL